MHSILSITLLIAPTVMIFLCISNANGAPVPPPLPTTSSPNHEDIIFYRNTNYRGSEVKFNMTMDTQNCYTFDGKQDFSSAKMPTGTCLKLFPAASCLGISATLLSSTHNFRDLSIEINDEVTSFRRCRKDEMVQTIPIEASETTPTPLSS